MSGRWSRCVEAKERSGVGRGVAGSPVPDLSGDPVFRLVWGVLCEPVVPRSGGPPAPAPLFPRLRLSERPGRLGGAACQAAVAPAGCRAAWFAFAFQVRKRGSPSKGTMLLSRHSRGTTCAWRDLLGFREWCVR